MMWFWDLVRINAFFDIFSVVCIIGLVIKVRSLEKRMSNDKL